MADHIDVKSASGVIHSGSGFLAGMVITASAGNPVVTFYDNTAGSGTKIFEAAIPSSGILSIFFTDRFAPRYTTGLYIALADGLSATIWSRQL
jgi:hypothetical protein